jgi:hypothetical protein
MAFFWLMIVVACSGFRGFLFCGGVGLRGYMRASALLYCTLFHR